MTAMRAPVSFRRNRLPMAALTALATAASLAIMGGPVLAQTQLADQPVFTNTAVPGNLALALSVEWPTVSRTAHPSNSYNSALIYRGYFDHEKCYRYVHVATETAIDVSRFDPVSMATNQLCPATGVAGEWSGNFLNWATMIAIDPFRWALTGGLRKVDEVGNTVLERARHSGQGLFPNRTVTNATLISNATPFNWGSLTIRSNGVGTRLVFTSTGTVDSTDPRPQYQQGAEDANTVYELQVRVKVCDPAFPEGNCKEYSPTNWKPEGLIQQYSDRMRFSAFGYLNDPAMLRDGGVLRAAQKFVGPKMPVPGALPITNPDFEWNAGTGVFRTNPNPTDATATSSEFGIPVANSGVINYLNKFGQLTTNPHKNYDPVSEMFYAVTRYFRNLGNVPAWTSMTGASVSNRTRFLDSFPVITNWVDPIQYACQRNFALGIGDIYTHRDKNLPGSPTGTVDEPPKPPEVAADLVDSVEYTTKAFALQGLGVPNVNSYSGRNNSAGMVGLAYYANTRDLRADFPGKQTMSTYWVDVLEQPFVANNQFYLAAKYGGFKVPNLFDPLSATTIDESWWHSTTDMVGTQKRPDNYFTAGAPDQMISGLNQAFADIAAQLSAFTTSFSTSLPQVALAGVGSYSATFDSAGWTSEITASETTFNPMTGAPSQVTAWTFNSKLAAQLTGMGWNTSRVMMSWNNSTTTGFGVPFRSANLSSTQMATLDTTLRLGDDSADFLNYLRGDTTHEVGSTASGSAKAYRTRTSLIGNIVGSKVRVVGAPAAPFSAATNPGYAAFKATWANRTPMLYVGTNAGVMHAINASLTGATAGREVFAYVPNALYKGANGVPAQTGLQHRSNPSMVHKYLVDGPVNVYDIDMGGACPKFPGWRSVLVGAMGKGGKGYFAIDVTDPSAFTTEAAAAKKVMWEFTHDLLGYTFGEPAAVKTKKWGWALIFGSGHNNSTGKGYIFILNPCTGALHEDPIPLGPEDTGTVSVPAGLAHVQVYIPDRTDFTAESLYAGDLLGNLWRLDLRQATGAYPAPVKLAELTDSTGSPVAVTSRPLIVVQPGSNRRFVTIGSGKLLHTSDVGNPKPQGFYAIIDGTGNVFNTDATLPANMSFPIRNKAPHNQLLKLTDHTQPVTMNFATQIGWWLDLGSSVAGPGWRVISDPTSFQGIVAFSAMTPSADPCTPSGTNRVYALDLGKGQSVLGDPGTPSLFNESLPGVITDLRFYSVNGKPRLVGGTDTGATGPLPGNWSNPSGTRRLNWRELPLAD